MENQGQTLNPGVMRGPITLIEKCQSFRSALLSFEKDIIALMKAPEFDKDATPVENFGEAKSNIMLAYRHFEDARMRLGKVIQAMDGGTSVYDKPKA
jgi:hypothetical protein